MDAQSCASRSVTVRKRAGETAVLAVAFDVPVTTPGGESTVTVVRR